MSNKSEFKSYMYHFLNYCRRISEILRFLDPEKFDDWQLWIEGLEFGFVSKDLASVTWQFPKIGEALLDTSGLKWYVSASSEESNVNNNLRIIKEHVRHASIMSGLQIDLENIEEVIKEGRFQQHFKEEELLSNTWAKSVDPAHIDVIQMNESITAPEMRFITSYLGDIENKTLIDIGCGLGEASVYFSLKGAQVTAVDISHDMLIVVDKLAEINNTKVKTHLASFDNLRLSDQDRFDIVYSGNVFHHVDIPEALNEVTSFMSDSSILVCWEPVAYNPLINLYRRIAKHVRSADEQPIRMADIDIFREYFSSVEVHWFWLTTLIIFIIMFIVQRRNPNIERYWKSVVMEGQKWAWLYKPLAGLDRWLLSVFPFLRPLCWNVVIIGKNPKPVK